MDEKKLTGLGREELLKIVRAQNDELSKIDDLVFDAMADSHESEIEHQIECHEDTVPTLLRQLAEHLRKINAVGEARREEEMNRIDPPKPPDEVV